MHGKVFKIPDHYNNSRLDNQSKKIDTVKAGFRVDNGLDQLEQCPAFTYAITSVNTLIGSHNPIK